MHATNNQDHIGSQVEDTEYVAPAFDVVDMIDTIGITKGSYGSAAGE